MLVSLYTRFLHYRLVCQIAVLVRSESSVIIIWKTAALR